MKHYSENKQKFPKGIEVIVGPYIINEKNQVLLFQSPKWVDQWVVCGGHIEIGESIKEATKRETLEEIGVEIEVLDIINIGEMIVSKPEFKRNAHFIFIDSIAKLKSENFKFNQEISACKWFDIDSAEKDETIKKSCRNVMTKIIEWLKTNKI